MRGESQGSVMSNAKNNTKNRNFSVGGWNIADKNFFLVCAIEPPTNP
jgi:hypothetical protein